MDRESFIEMYTRRAKINFQKEIDIREHTRLHELAYTLGIPFENVKQLWYDVSREEVENEVSPMSCKNDGKWVHSS